MAVITYLTRIVFDFGAVRQLPDELATLNIRRPLIVTDPGIASIGLLDNVKAVLPAQLEIAVYSDTPANPTEAATLAALEIYQANDCDGIIAIGGGSSLDLAKGVRLLATHPGPLAQYALVDGGVARIRADVAPLIAVPTTAGTGSEVGRGAVLIMQDGHKLGVISPHLIPNVAWVWGDWVPVPMTICTVSVSSLPEPTVTRASSNATARKAGASCTPIPRTPASGSV
jgi:alcohol dehydrogenase class IV